MDFQGDYDKNPTKIRNHSNIESLHVFKFSFNYLYIKENILIDISIVMVQNSHMEFESDPKKSAIISQSLGFISMKLKLFGMTLI